MVKVIDGADATGSNYASLPHGLQYAGYSTGSGGVAWTAAQWAAHPTALRICQDANASDVTADILDVENGAATLADCPVWAKKAVTTFKAGTRPGQRSPAIYCSASNVTSVINALIAGGVKSGIGLYVANWNLSREEAAAELGKSSGPWPVVGYQFSDMGAYDLDVWTSSWVNNVSKKGVPPVSAEAPPGQWLDAATWTWADCILVGKGLDGNLHVFTFNPQKGTWTETE